MRLLLGLVISFAAVLPAAAEPSIRDLSWLIGRWSFEDRSTPATGYDYAESGVRECAWALDDRYIRCESRGVSKGKTRTYVFYLGFNSETGRFEMLSLFGNTPARALYEISVSEGGRRLDMVSSYDEDGQPRRTWGVLTYDGSSSYVWESTSGPANAAQRPPTRFIDTVRRLEN